jgi:hypothetical protein
VRIIPISDNGKFFFLYYGETMEFRLTNLDHAMKTMENNQITELGERFYRHFSDRPFPNGRMVHPCEGPIHCEICAMRLKPTALFVTEIAIMDGESERTLIMDMRASAHSAILNVVNNLLDQGATFGDLLTARLKLTRLAKGQKPWFNASLVSDFSASEPAEKIMRISPEEMSVLESLDAWLRMHPEVKNTRGSIIKTLREREKWSEDKISFVFETVLDDNGFVKGVKE